MDLCEMVCLCFASACDEEMMLKASLVQVGTVNSYKGFESVKVMSISVLSMCACTGTNILLGGEKSLETS